MQINALENLIINSLGSKKPAVAPATNVKPAYATAPTSQPVVMEVHDSHQSNNVKVPVTTDNQATIEVENIVPYPTDNAPTSNNGHGSNDKQDAYAQKVDTAVATLVKDKDYGTIDGVKGYVIFRSGLIKILRHMGYRYVSKLVDKQIVASERLIAYTIQVDIIDRDGNLVVSELGSSNSLEKKFAAKNLSSDNILSAIANTRALRAAVKSIIVR